MRVRRGTSECHPVTSVRSSGLHVSKPYIILWPHSSVLLLHGWGVSLSPGPTLAKKKRNSCKITLLQLDDLLAMIDVKGDTQNLVWEVPIRPDDVCRFKTKTNPKNTPFL